MADVSVILKEEAAEIKDVVVTAITDNTVSCGCGGWRYALHITRPPKKTSPPKLEVFEKKEDKTETPPTQPAVELLSTFQSPVSKLFLH